MIIKHISKDKDVVHVDDQPPFSDHVGEEVIHQRLKGGRGVTEPEEHDGGFKQSALACESGLPLVSFLDPDVVISSAEVQFRVVLRGSESIEGFS